MRHCDSETITEVSKLRKEVWELEDKFVKYSMDFDDVVNLEPEEIEGIKCLSNVVDLFLGVLQTFENDLDEIKKNNDEIKRRFDVIEKEIKSIQTK